MPQLLRQPNENEKALAAAAETGDFSKIYLLIHNKYSNNLNLDVNAQIPTEKEGEYVFPLYLAAKNGHVKAINRLLEFGDANLEQVDNANNTALHAAAAAGQAAVVKQLLEYQANRHAINDDGNLPLHLAVISKNNATVNALLQHVECSEFYTDNYEGKTVIDLAEVHLHKTITLSMKQTYNQMVKNLDMQNVQLQNSVDQLTKLLQEEQKKVLELREALSKKEKVSQPQSQINASRDTIPIATLATSLSSLTTGRPTKKDEDISPNTYNSSEQRPSYTCRK
jgi:ankyrin repeat protein